MTNLENNIKSVLKLWQKLTDNKIDYLKIWENCNLKFMIIEDLLGSKNEKGNKIFTSMEIELISQLVDELDVSGYSNLDELMSLNEDGWTIYGDNDQDIKIIPMRTRKKFQRELKVLITDNILDKFSDLIMCLKPEFVQDVLVDGCYLQPRQTDMTRFSSGPLNFSQLNVSDIFLNDDQFRDKYTISDMTKTAGQPKKCKESKA